MFRGKINKILHYFISRKVTFELIYWVTIPEIPQNNFLPEFSHFLSITLPLKIHSSVASFIHFELFKSKYSHFSKVIHWKFDYFIFKYN